VDPQPQTEQKPVRSKTLNVAPPEEKEAEKAPDQEDFVDEKDAPADWLSKPKVYKGTSVS
jgi:hypothetical protein